MMEQFTPLPDATGLGTSVTCELRADLVAERIDMRLLRLELSGRICERGRRVTKPISVAARTRGCASEPLRQLLEVSVDGADVVVEGTAGVAVALAGVVELVVVVGAWARTGSE
jgi:hypothetical protein